MHSGGRLVGADGNGERQSDRNASFTVAAGAMSWSASVALGSFVRGTIQVNASGFNVACASVSASTAPTWVADVITTDLAPGKQSAPVLNFRQNYPLQASGKLAPSVVDFSMGTYSRVLRLVDGTVRVIGSSASLPAPTGLTSVVEVGVGSDHACVRKSDGTVWCWGANGSGQLGNGTNTGSGSVPVQAMGISGAIHIAVGNSVSCAVTSTDTYCWGYNGNGALGDGSTMNRPLPTPLGLGQMDAIAADIDHTCFVSNGRISCAGNNNYGQLGNGAMTSSLITIRQEFTLVEVAAQAPAEHHRLKRQKAVGKGLPSRASVVLEMTA